MRFERYLVDVPASGVGEIRDVHQLHDKWLHVSGLTAAGATLNFEVTCDETNFLAVQVAAFGDNPLKDVIADGLYELPQNVYQVRINRTVAGSGEVVVTLAGRMAHG
jgi:hypothetical protein